jgi:M6 family metalloprotease-like protein
MTAGAARFLASVAILVFVATSAANRASAQIIERGSVDGVLGVVWGDAKPGVSADAQVIYTLVDDAGAQIVLQLDAGVLGAVGGITAVNGRRVTATGDWLQSAVADGGSQVLRVSSLALETSADGRAAGDAEPQAITGPQPWVNVLCKFGDMTMAFPAQPSHYAALMGSTFPGMNHYWRETSYDHVNITGTQVTQWYNLPHPRSYYVYNGIFDFTRATNDCVAAADADVYFPNFVGINLIFNFDLDGFAYGGIWWINVDGRAKMYRTTWMPPWAQTPAVFAHEMGHGFGLPHSSGPYDTPYDSSWDPMSDTYNNPPVDPAYGDLPVHTIARHKDLLGWIPSGRKLVLTPGSTQTVTLEAMGLSPILPNSYQIIKIPLGCARTHAGELISYYTIEARLPYQNNYDSRIPGKGVVIHKVLLGRGDREAQVVDVDWNGNPDDAGASWLPGETFTNAAIGLTVRVVSETATGFTVTVTLDPTTNPTSDFDADGRRDLLWRHTSGQTAIWFMNAGDTLGGGSFTSVDPSWSIVGNGDYNGDGRSDLLWRHRSGTVRVWFMDGTRTIGGGDVANVDLSWQIVGTADHNNDGKADILWRNSSGLVVIWLMDGSQVRSTGVAGAAELAWQIAGSGDYNADGRADILWRHTSGQVVIWFVNGTRSIDIGGVGSVDAGWHIAGTGDHNGDGYADILWRHTSGQVALWFMNGSRIVGGGGFSIVDPDWVIAGQQDFDGDGCADILWRHTSGEGAIWFMDGLRALRGAGFQAIDPAWVLVDTDQPPAVP